MTEQNTDTYVTHADWLRATGRVDLIDEVADHFEKPATSIWPQTNGAFWTRTSANWPHSSGALRSAGLLHARSAQRST